jgi:predicted homoserine dehydrogenase-like protein
VVDVVNTLRRPDEASFAGGVFDVVRCEDRKTWEVLAAKGHVVSRSGQAAMIYRPSHLLGVESATTVLTAGLQGRSSGPDDIQPRFDVIGRATRLLKAGTLLVAAGHHHEIDGVEGLIVPARRAEGTNPLPFYMMADNTLVTDVPAGSLVTADKVAAPKASRLWALRREMEAVFALS